MAGDFKNLDADLNCHEPQNPKHKPSRMIVSSTVTNRPSGERLFSLPISCDGGRLQKLGCLSMRDDPSARHLLSHARPDDALFVDFNSRFEAVFIRGE